MEFTDAVKTVTREKIIPEVFDTVSQGSPFLMTMLQNAKEWRTGFQLQFILKYQDSTNGGNIGIADKLDTNRQEVRVKSKFNPKMAYKPVVIAHIETALNSGDEQVLDLLETEFDSQASSLMTLMADNLFAGNGTGNEWDSITNAADDATNFATYGTLTRSTYSPALDGYYLASAGVLTLAKLATAWRSVRVGMDKPTMHVTTESIWDTYESLLTPTVRAGYTQNGFPQMNAFGMVPQSAALAGTQGFEVVFFRGVPVVADEQCPSGRFYLINTKFFRFYGIDLSKASKNIETLNFKKQRQGTPLGVPGRVPSTRGFNFRLMMDPVDQLAEVGHLFYAGNFAAANPRLQGQMRGVT